MSKPLLRLRTIVGRASLLSLLSLGLASAGCKQGEGEVCQVNEDCEDGLTCIASTGLCQEPGSSVSVDAEVVDIDASTIDAAVPDAEVPDAEVPDADPPDAAPMM